MPKKTSVAGSELFIVDNSDENWKVLRYLHDWCQLSKAIDIATGYFEIGSLIALDGEWQKVDQIRILMGDEVSRRTKNAFVYSQLRKMILKGKFKKGDKLFQEEIAGTFGVSLATVSKVYAQLLKDKLIVQKRKAGTFSDP
jgi:hypothetical protein